MRTFSLSEINERIKQAAGVHLLIQARRKQRPADTKTRSQAEKLLLIEIANRKWRQEMERISERKWKYVGK